MPETAPLILGRSLLDAGALDPALALYLPENERWTLETRVWLLDPDEVEDEDDELPGFALDHGLQYGLLTAEVAAVVGNARAQRGHPSPDDLLRACLHYYDHDAYIDFGREDEAAARVGLERGREA